MRNIGIDIPVKINPVEHEDIILQLIGYASVLCAGIWCVLHFHKNGIINSENRYIHGWIDR